MRINAKIDISGALRTFDTIKKKLSYASNSALTRIAKECIDEGQKEIAADFTIRKRFILTRLQILQYSRVNTLTTIVGINSDVQGSSLLLGFFEEGGTKTPEHGDVIAVPITGSPARPQFTSPIRNALKYTNLQIENKKGKRRTYVVEGVGIFERIRKGDDPGATILIYKFESSAPLKKHMNLIEVMVQRVRDRWNAIYLEEFEKEVKRYLGHHGR